MQITGKVELSIPEYHELIAYKEAVLKRLPVLLWSDNRCNVFFDSTDQAIDELKNHIKELQDYIDEKDNKKEDVITTKYVAEQTRKKLLKKWWQL